MSTGLSSSRIDWSSKMSKKIALNRVSLEFDGKSGFIYLKSKDRLLRGKPMRLTVADGTESYDSLLSVIETRSSGTLGTIHLPSRLELDDPMDLISEADHELIVGVNPEGPEIWDLNHTPGALIVGGPGSGRSVLLRLLALRAAVDPAVSFYGLDPRAIELPQEYFGQNDLHGKTRDQIETVIDHTLKQIQDRYEELQQMGLNHRSDMRPGDRFPQIYLTLEELEGWVELYGEDEEALQVQFNRLTEITRIGRTVGVQLFIFSSGRLSLPGPLSANMCRRVVVGGLDGGTAYRILGDDPYLSDSYLSVPGRAVVRIGSEQSLVHFYCTPMDIFGRL